VSARSSFQRRRDGVIERAYERRPRLRRAYARKFDQRRDLRENHKADDGRSCRQHGEHQRKGGARQSRHSELIADVRDDRGRYSDTNPRKDQYGLGKHGDDFRDSDRQGDNV